MTRRKLSILLVLFGTFLILAAYEYYLLWFTPYVPTTGFTAIYTNQKVVALTFDDGPHALYTQQILDVLKQKNVKATFFVVGKTAQNKPQLLRRMYREGHEIDNHSFTHDYRQRRIVNEINLTDQVVFAATGIHTSYYRPPGGYVYKNQEGTIKRNGYVLTLWSVDSKDWTSPGVNTIVNNVVNNTFPGAIILMHDGGGSRNQTVQALGQIISILSAKGYRFVTLSQLQEF